VSDYLDRIRDLADELTEPRVNREPYTVWTGSRHRVVHHHVTVEHGLITQLYRAVLTAQAGGDDAGRSVPGSRPPLEVEALSRHEQITAAARAWRADLGLPDRGTAEYNIRALVGAARELTDTDRKALAADLRRWAGWCRVYLGLERIHTARGVRCPVAECATLGTLRVNLTTSTGLCVACGATWDQDNIGVLANHIKDSKGAAA
jgi:hypothetical protein